MQGVEAELERLMNEWAAAEDDLVRRGGQVERLAAPHRLKLKKENPPAKQLIEKALFMDLAHDSRELSMGRNNVRDPGSHRLPVGHDTLVHPESMDVDYIELAYPLPQE